jgi:hypothetical protein
MKQREGEHRKARREVKEGGWGERETADGCGKSGPTASRVRQRQGRQPSARASARLTRSLMC